MAQLIKLAKLEN